MRQSARRFLLNSGPASAFTKKDAGDLGPNTLSAQITDAHE
jgi:hypothetical protein